MLFLLEKSLIKRLHRESRVSFGGGCLAIGKESTGKAVHEKKNTKWKTFFTSVLFSRLSIEKSGESRLGPGEDLCHRQTK